MQADILLEKLQKVTSVHLLIKECRFVLCSMTDVFIYFYFVLRSGRAAVTSLGIDLDILIQFTVR